MPRRARLDAPGVPVHVTDRGDEGRALFVTDEDRDFVVARAAEVFADEGVRCLAFAVMTNHWHFLLLPGEEPLARTMLRLKVGIARRHRSRRGERGHVFQGRYHTNCLVRRRRDGRADEAALPSVVLYILLNPHQAGITRSLEELANWRWTSLPDLLGLRKPVLTDVSAALGALGGDSEGSRRWLVRALSARISGDADPAMEGDGPSLPAGAVHVTLPPRAVADARMREGQVAATGEAAARALALPTASAQPGQPASDVTSDVRRCRRAALEALGWTPACLVAAACARLRADVHAVRAGTRTRAESAARSVAIAVGCDALAVAVGEMAVATGIGVSAAGVARNRGRRLVRELGIDPQALVAPPGV